MSYCEVISFKNGKPDDSLECRNAWGGAAFIWTKLYDKYLKDPHKQYDSWLSGGLAGETDRRLWDLYKRRDIPRFLRAVHVSTFDRAIVARENLKQFASDLREFVKYFGTGDSVCHLTTWADWIDAHPDIEAVGFYGTSVSENLWYDYDEEKDESIPYDLNTGDKHLEVYELLDEVDAACNVPKEN